MLWRRRRLTLSNGAVIETPLIIPSLSTRNVGRIDYDEKPESIASAALRIVGQQLTEAVLVSAYDLHHRRLVDSDRLLQGAIDTVFDHAALLMIDSGLYETRERVGYDDAVAGADGTWTVESYGTVLGALPSMPIAIVNFDADHLPFGNQIAAGQTLFAAHRARASVMLLKPETTRGFVDAARLGAVAGDLRGFDVIAVTEKELGDTLLERLRALARIRKRLDDEDVQAPLHVFGGLDPLLTPLYIACGAEIVDGVGWLRYSYEDDVAHYQEARAVLGLDLDSPVRVRIFATINRNLHYLRDLKRRLELLIDEDDWQRFSRHHGSTLEDIWRRVASGQGVF
jgi:hypothetical protein